MRMARPPREKWMVFYSTPDFVEASILLALLKSAGIPVVQQRTGASVYGVGTANLLVPRERLDDAQRVVDEARNAGEPKEGDNGHYGQ